MKKFLLIILTLSLCGCMTLQQKQEDEQRGQNFRMLSEAAQQKRNLVGLTKQQIIDQFGAPGNVNTSYGLNGTTELLGYAYFMNYGHCGSFCTEGLINITLTNGMVTNVTYD